MIEIYTRLYENPELKTLNYFVITYSEKGFVVVLSIVGLTFRAFNDGDLGYTTKYD